MDGNHGRRGGARGARKLRQRKASLVAVARSHRRAEMILRDFLEARQVLMRGVGVAFALKCARNAKFGRGMEGI